MTTSADHTSLPAEVGPQVAAAPPVPVKAERQVVVPMPSFLADLDGPNSPPPTGTPVAASPPAEPRDLAAEARWRRSERRGRVMLIESSAQLTLRVRHPSGGDCSVEEI